MIGIDEVKLFVLVAFIEGFLHYFRWKHLLQGAELPRPVAYILGVLGLMVPFSLWLYEQHDIRVLVVLWGVILAGGIAVILCYFIDWVVDLIWDKRQALQRERALSDVKK
jgi:hypothetical protein